MRQWRRCAEAEQRQLEEVLVGVWGIILFTIICDCAQGMDEDEWELIGLERGLVSACQDYITQFYYWCKVYFLI